MGYREPTKEDIKVSTSFTNKGQLARKGCIFLVFTLKDQMGTRRYVKEVDRAGTSKELEAEYIEDVKEQLINNINKKAHV